MWAWPSWASANTSKKAIVVKRTGRIADVPVGDAVLGRVIDSVGNPLDGKGPIETDERRRIEMVAPGVVARKSVHEPLYTGLKAIDAMTPVGQRPARIGHRRPPDRKNRHLGGRHHQPKGPGR